MESRVVSIFHNIVVGKDWKAEYRSTLFICRKANARGEKLPETIWGGKNRLLLKKFRGKKK